MGVGCNKIVFFNGGLGVTFFSRVVALVPPPVLVFFTNTRSKQQTIRWSIRFSRPKLGKCKGVFKREDVQRDFLKFTSLQILKNLRNEHSPLQQELLVCAKDRNHQ
jgi:hypothetical protein